MSKWSVAKETIESASQMATEHAADEVGMLEALISTALVSLNARKGKEYVQAFVDYEVSSLNRTHHDVKRLTQKVFESCFGRFWAQYCLARAC
jgi:hypothetical protein